MLWRKRIFNKRIVGCQNFLKNFNNSKDNKKIKKK